MYIKFFLRSAFCGIIIHLAAHAETEGRGQCAVGEIPRCVRSSGGHGGLYPGESMFMNMVCTVCFACVCVGRKTVWDAFSPCSCSLDQEWILWRQRSTSGAWRHQSLGPCV